MNNSNENNSNMFPSSPGGGGRLMRYGSAPSSVLSTAMDSILSSAAALAAPAHPSLVRHSSLPAGIRNDYLPDNGFSITSYYNSKGIADNNGHGVSRLNPRFSFAHAPKEALSRIYEETENNADHSNTADGAAKRSSSHSDVTGACFTVGLWDENHHLTFSVSPTKLPHAIHTNGPHDTMESQFQFGVPCKIRAKRGFATHPRSIAERERRTRISGKLKKLQDLVPNMDKQTSYANMLDLAVQHIKTLQHEVQNLNQELDNCGCGCKQTTTS